MKTTICFVAGHSGGHITPSLTRAQQLLESKAADNILFFATTAPLDKKIVTGHPAIHQLVLLNVGAVPYKKKWLFPLFILKLTAAFFRSLYHLYRSKPTKIISMGGYVSLPVCFAGWLLRIPIELYELNVEPGKALTFIAPLAQTIWILYPETALYLPTEKCQLTTYPVRFSAAEKVSREEAITSLNLSPSRKTIFILGGSQGSIFLSTLVKEWIEHSPALIPHVQIIHQTGDQDTYDWKTFYTQHGVTALIFTYHPHLAELYQAADLIISRAGAGTLAELNFFQKKSIIIPLETAMTSHQKYNAQAFARKNPKLFFVMQQKEIEKNKSYALKKINDLLAID